MAVGPRADVIYGGCPTRVRLLVHSVDGVAIGGRSSRPTSTRLRVGRSESTRRWALTNVAVIGGDGIGPDVVAEALKVVAAAGVRCETTGYDLGAGRYVRTGEVLPDGVLEELRGHDAILLGAVGPPVGPLDVPAGALERGLLLRLRFELDLYVNLRPCNGVPGAIAPDADLCIVRENTEGPYAGEGGVLRRGTPWEVATQGSVNTRHGVERCVRYAFELARTRPRRSVTLVHKTNVLTYAGDLWHRAFNEVAALFPGIATVYHHVDAACIYLATEPDRYDVIVTDNLFGDILSDLAGAVTGGIGLAASANLNPERTRPVALRARARSRPRHRRHRTGEPARRHPFCRDDGGVAR